MVIPPPTQGKVEVMQMSQLNGNSLTECAVATRRAGRRLASTTIVSSTGSHAELISGAGPCDPSLVPC